MSAEPSNDNSYPDNADVGTDAGVTVPETFQKEVHSVISKAKTKSHLNHISDRVSEAHEKLVEASMAKDNAGKGKKGGKTVQVPDEMSTAGMP
jgi:hypothetical protein